MQLQKKKKEKNTFFVVEKSLMGGENPPLPPLPGKSHDKLRYESFTPI